MMNHPSSPSAGARHSLCSTPDALAAFAHWQQAELGPGREADAAADPDSATPATGYALVWNAWVLQLCGGPSPAVTWHEATAEDVARFLQIRPGQRAHHQPGRQISEVTRRRYWRLLDRIYAHALLHGWVTHNPVQEVQPMERPAPEQVLGHVLPPALWKALPRYFPGSDDRQSARDQAVLRLLYDLALAPEEVRMLTLASLDGPGHLQINGLRAAQSRRLALPAQTRKALATWLPFRTPGTTPWPGDAPLFESRKGGPLTIRALFHIASKTIALAQQASRDRDMPLARMGPQVIRNTAIVHWLRDGVPATEVVQRIGVDHPRALAHLQHCVDALAPVRLS